MIYILSLSSFLSPKTGFKKFMYVVVIVKPKPAHSYWNDLVQIKKVRKMQNSCILGQHNYYTKIVVNGWFDIRVYKK